MMGGFNPMMGMGMGMGRFGMGGMGGVGAMNLMATAAGTMGGGNMGMGGAGGVGVSGMHLEMGPIGMTGTGVGMCHGRCILSSLIFYFERHVTVGYFT